ncbi:MAG TPA: uroporphyrinogen-III synthase [Candidatus Eisenbacteria bacterium]|jgi:uroporphyrinogen-III synthase|nr:uroporphyrinogen-III synthase [Candidatus Eisenbacteria bacterium]
MSESRPMLLMTRRDAADDGLARAAEVEGCEVARLELFETRPGAQIEALEAWLSSPPPDAALAWTSRRAAARLAEIAFPRHRKALERLRLFAVGEESAMPIAAAGLPVSTPEGGLGAGHLAEHLIERIHEMGIRRVVFLHGDRALPDLPESLARAGIPVERLEVYRTAYLAADPAPLVHALDARRPCVVAFYSPSGIAGLERLLPPEVGESLHQDAIALARGETTYKALLRWGYARSQRPVGPKFGTFDAFVLDAVQSIVRSPR